MRTNLIKKKETPKVEKEKIVAFGDYCDMNSKSDFGNAYQVIDLTDNEKELIKFVKNARNTSGGDGDELYELVRRNFLERGFY